MILATDALTLLKINKGQRGFTLIEIMVVVFIIAIMSAIVFPSYRAYITQSTQADVQKKMLSLSTELQQWRAKALTYKGFTPKNDTINSSGEISYPSSGNAYYTITLGELDSGGNFRVLTQGTSWVMLAIPNDPGRFSNANTYLMKSDGSRCYVDHTQSLTVASSCTGAESW